MDICKYASHSQDRSMYSENLKIRQMAGNVSTIAAMTRDFSAKVGAASVCTTTVVMAPVPVISGMARGKTEIS